MKGKKIVNIRTHIGIYQFAGLQSIDLPRLGKDGAMEMNAVGVLVTGTVGTALKQVFVPFANIVSIEMIDEK